MDFKELRKLFPVTKNYVYLNHAGVAPIPTVVKKAADDFLKGYLEKGFLAAPEWRGVEKAARQNAAKLLNAEPAEIAFTGSTSQGLSMVAAGLRWKSGDNLLVPDCEFPSNLYPWLNLREKGVEARLIPSRDERIELADIEKLADNRTRMLAVSSVQYGSGFRAPLEKWGAWCRGRGIFFCVDAIQSLGALAMDVKKYQIDFLAADGHKWLLAPEGTALFFCSRRAWGNVAPEIVGWKTVVDPLDFDRIHFTPRQDAQKFEPGSNNLLGIHALNASMELLLSAGPKKIEERVLSLTCELVERVRSDWPEARVASPRAAGERSGIVAVKIPGDPQAAVQKLLKKKIFVSSRRGFLRFSPHCYNTSEELKFVVQIARQIR